MDHSTEPQQAQPSRWRPLRRHRWKWLLLGIGLGLALARLALGPGQPAEVQASQPTVTASPVAPVGCDSQSFGDQLPAGPILSPITFATRQDQAGWPLDPALQFTTTVTRVQASFGYAGMRNGMAWERVWYFDDRELLRGSGTWDAGPRGELSLYTTPQEGRFVPGRYRLELYVEGRPLSQGTFLVVAGDTATQRPVEVVYTTWAGDHTRLDRLTLENGQAEPLVEFGREPALSLDTPGLLFYGEEGIAGGTAGLWIFNLDLKKAYQLNGETFFQSLAWSPQRAFVASARPEGPMARLVLWDIVASKAYPGPLGQDPAWSPEGRRLAYRGCDSAGWGISTVHVISSTFDTASIRQLTSGDDSQPAWSWDGQRIAFVRREGANQDIYMIAADGTALTRLTTHPAADTSPAWTPDNRLVFRSLRTGTWGLYLMAADGTGQRRLVDTPAAPNWQPDRPAVSSNVRLVEPTPRGPEVEIPPGRGLLVISNRKNNDEMTFTIDNQEHKVKPFQVSWLALKPGHYTWTASWPAKTGHTGIADIVVGQVAYPVVER